jgi:protein-tyrosine phosphatase
LDWITDRVAIGNYLEARDAALLKERGIRSAISLDGTLTERQAADLGLSEVASYPLVDGPGNDLRVLRFAVDDLRRLAAQGPVLVQCHAGRSRSVAVVAAYLMEAHRISAREAISRVAARREINVTPALVDLLRKLEM